MTSTRYRGTASQTEPLSVKKNLIWNTVGCLMYQGCLWMTTVLVVLLSNYANSGALAYAMAIGNIFNPIAMYNMRTYQVSDVHNKYTTGNYVAMRMVTIGIALAFIAAYCMVTVSSLELTVTILVYLLFKTDEAFCAVYYAVVQKADRMDYIGISQGLRGLIIITTFSLGLVLTGNLNVAVLMMSLGCMLVTFLYDVRKAALMGDVRPHIDRPTCRRMLAECLPAALTMVCYGSVVSVARQLFGNSYGSEALGIYAAIATPTVIIQVAASYLTSPFLVNLSRAWAERRVRDFGRSLARIVGGVLAVFLVALLVAELFGRDLLVLVYGESIAAHSYLLPHVILATGTVAFAGLLMDILVVLRELRWSLVANGTALVLSFLLSAWLESGLYMNGINVTVIVSFCASLAVSLTVIANRMARMRGEGQ